MWPGVWPAGSHAREALILCLGHSNMIHCFPFHQEAWGMRVGGSLFIIHYHYMY